MVGMPFGQSQMSILADCWSGLDAAPRPEAVSNRDETYFAEARAEQSKVRRVEV